MQEKGWGVAHGGLPRQPLKWHGGAPQGEKEHRARRPPSGRVPAQPQTSCVTQGRPRPSLSLSFPG